MTQKQAFKILIIDDNPDIHQDFIKILHNSQSSGKLDDLSATLFGGADEQSNIELPDFKIDTATQGEEGLEKVKQAAEAGEPYALAFIDVRMPPGWDGIKTAKHIWEHDQEIQIVICTAYSDYSWEETTAELGQSDNLLILKKPFDSTSVRQLACALTRKWRLMQEQRTYTNNLEMKVEQRTQELKHMATHDLLTGLPNRLMLQDNINRVLADKSPEKLFAIVFIDLDRFKLINDSLSHAVGDKLLAEVATRINAILPDQYMLARIGGDEFVLLLENLDSKDDIDQLVQKVLAELRKPVEINGHSLLVTGSLGVSVFPEHGEAIDQLISGADAAMYLAKKQGGNQYQYFKPSMKQASLKSLELEIELRKAIENSEFKLCYQPIYSMSSKQLVAVEALIRWQHPERGMILPKDFIPLAEDTGLILPIGAWVIREACRQNKHWQDNGLPNIRVAVNVTTQQLQQIDFVDVVSKILKEEQLQPELLEIELSERAIVSSGDAMSVIKRLRELGIKVSIDDFGTGNSSINCLKNLTLDRIKIDRSFISNIKSNSTDEIIIKAIIEMAQGLNLAVIAEGVENAKQMSFLKRQDCSEVQGFYFSSPLFADEIEDVLKEAATPMISDDNKEISE